MKRFLGSLAAIGLALYFIGCSENSSSGPGKTVTLDPDAGRFGLSHLKGLNKAQAPFPSIRRIPNHIFVSLSTMPSRF